MSPDRLIREVLIVLIAAGAMWLAARMTTLYAPVSATLLLSYAVFQAFLYWLRKHRDAFAAERLLSMRGFDKVMLAWILAGVLFQIAFAAYFAVTVGIMPLAVLLLGSFIVSLPLQIAPTVFLQRYTATVMALASFAAMPLCAWLMVSALHR